MQVMSADPLIFPRRFAVGLLLTRYDVSFDIAYRDQHRWTLEVILKPQRLTLHRLGVRHVHRSSQFSTLASLEILESPIADKLPGTLSAKPENLRIGHHRAMCIYPVVVMP